MALILLTTQAKVETLVGGQPEFAKLTDVRHQGTPWADLVAMAIEAASAWVLSATGVQVTQASQLGRTDLAHFQDLATIYAAERAWIMGTKGQALPKFLQALVDRANTQLDRLVERKRTPAADPDLEPAAPMYLVDFDPDGVKVTRETMKGFH